MTGLTGNARSSQHAAVSDLAKRIKELRERRELSMNDLDDLCSMSEGYISRVEGGSRQALRPQTVELLAAALRSTFGYIGAGLGPPNETPPSPAHWRDTRKGVAMRVLRARGFSVELIEAAAERYGAKDETNETTSSLVANIEQEIKNPTPPDELAARAQRLLDSQERDTLAMARRAAAALEGEHGIAPTTAWGIMREVRLHKPTTDGLIDEALRLLQLQTSGKPTISDDAHARSQLEREPGKALPKKKARRR